VHEDAKNIATTSNHEVELVKFEYLVISQVYHDLVAVYMEEFFFSEYPLIPKVSGIVHRPRALCCKDQTGDQLVLPVQVLFLILIENIERAELVEKLLDWLH